MQIPYIASEWETLFQPRKFGRYVNDHTIYQSADGIWHLIGITSRTGKPSDERYFVSAQGVSLTQKMQETAKVIDTGTLAWAPCVVCYNDLYYMYYGPSPTKLAVSHDSIEWFGYEIKMCGLPPMACHRDHFVLPLEEGKWLMYASGIHKQKSSICVLESNDLQTWQFKGFALTSGEKAPLNPSWGAFESPYVVNYDDCFYLFVTYTDCSKQTYNDTLVFCSQDPYAFGCYMGKEKTAEPVALLHAHAPEIICHNDKWYITSCGWKRSSFTRGAVQIAQLKWEKM